MLMEIRGRSKRKSEKLENSVNHRGIDEKLHKY
jgi:hypothetical protein